VAKPWRRISPPKIPSLRQRNGRLRQGDSKSRGPRSHWEASIHDDLQPAACFTQSATPPSFGATLTSCDDSVAKAMTGVVVVRDGSLSRSRAKCARAQKLLMRFTPNGRKCADLEQEIFSYLRQNAAAKSEDRFRKQKVPWKRAASAAHRLDATYTLPTSRMFRSSREQP